MRIVPIECINEGSILAKTIYDDEGRVLLREGVTLSNSLLKRVKLNKIYSLYIHDKYSTIELDDVIKPELRQKAIKTIKHTFSNFEKCTSYLSSNSRMNNELLKKRQDYFSTMGEICEQIIEEILHKKNALVNLVDIKSMDNYTYQHSVNVAVVSLILGIHLQLTKDELYKLCMGALLHDIGKVFIPINVLNKPGKLTEDEFKMVKEHTIKGYDYLKGSIDIPATVRIIPLQHHERVDGNGYPENVGKEKISKLAKIVAIADVYDALTSDRPYRKAISPNEAFEYIMAHANTQFDYSIVNVFSKTIIPYPEGTLVKLSNGDIGIVTGNSSYFPLRPTVRLIKSSSSEKTNTILNLMDELDIVIEKIEYEEPS